MSPQVDELSEFIDAFFSTNPGCSKDAMAKAVQQKFSLTLARSVYYNDSFAIRFSSSKDESFSNVVLSLSALRKYDDRPFLVCVVRPTRVELLLSNSSLLKRISHSSHQLSETNIKGSYLGHDIYRSVGSVLNVRENFSTLYSLHTENDWEDTLARLVASTGAIAATGEMFEPDEAQRKNILSNPNLAKLLSSHPEYLALGKELSTLVEQKKNEILAAADLAYNNVNIRGNLIEQIITEGSNFHGVEDISRTLDFGPSVKIDIKTKILTLSSSPKGYNVDKILSVLSDGKTVVSFFFVGIEPVKRRVLTCLVSILDKTIINATRVQFHWAGRNSRGVTQLAGDLSVLFTSGFREDIDVILARQFLEKLLALVPGILSP